MSTPSRGRKSAVSSTISTGAPAPQSQPQSQSSSNASSTNRASVRNEHDPTSPSPATSQKRSMDQRRCSFSSTRTKHSTYTEADSQWRGIFDDALAKAQQAVQLDESGETIMSSNLYSQAASDLGRVITMCSSDRKKQSMLAIQAIYLDRVSQLKVAQLPKGGQAISTQPGTPTPTMGDASSRATQYFVPQPQGMVNGQEDRILAQPLATHPNQRPQSISGKQQPQRASTVQPDRASRSEHQDKGFKLFGKKRSKSQSAVSHPSGAFDSAQANYTLANSSSVMLGNNGSVNPPGPVSTPSSESPATNAGSGSVDAPLSKSVTDSPESFKPTGSKWRPFGKKKSKSFSGGLDQVMSQGTYQSTESPPSLPPMTLGTNSPDTTSSSEYFAEVTAVADSNLQRQQKSNGQVAKNSSGPKSVQASTEGRRGSQDNVSTLYDRDEDDDVDPFYVVDIKGRARAFEGKDSGKVKKQASGTLSFSPKEDLKKVPKKPALKQSTSSYSNNQPFTPTFSPGTFTQQTSVSLQDLGSPRLSGALYSSSNAGSTASLGTPTRRPSQDRRRTMDIYTSSFIDDCDSETVLQINSTPMQMRLQQDPRHQMLISQSTEPVQPVLEPSMESPISAHHWPQSDRQHGPSVEDKKNTNTEEDSEEKTKGKSKWFNKSKKEQAPDRLDDVLKLMDEALFGGPTSATVKKNETAKKNKQSATQESTPSTSKPSQPIQQNPTGGPVISPRKESLADFGATVVSNPTISSVHDDTAPFIDGEGGFVVVESEEILLKDEPMSAKFAQNPLIPIAYEPRTTYTSKKQQSQKDKDGELHSPTFTRSMSGDLVTDPSKSTTDSTGSPLSATFNRSETLESEKPTTESTTAKSSTAGSMAMALFKNSIGKGKKKEEESDEYVPYEYQEEVEGPLMERVSVTKVHETIGFVMPIDESGMQTDDIPSETGPDNWDSWVTQLESFEQVLVDKGPQNDRLKSKASGPTYFEPQSPMPTPFQISRLDSGSSTAGSAFSSRPGTSMTDTSRPSTSMTTNTSLATTPTVEYAENPLNEAVKNSSTNGVVKCEADVDNHCEDEEEDNTIDRRESLQSSASTAVVVGKRLTVQPVQQAKKQWWAPQQRKETMSADGDIEEANSGSDQEQERHLALLLNSHNIQDQLDAAMEAAARTSESDSISSTEMSSSTSSIITARQVPMNSPKSITKAIGKGLRNGSDIEQDEENSRIAPMPKPKAQPKSVKSKLLPISTPLSHLLQLSNPDELWKYAQQAKAFATTKMNKGDKRSAAIALKRAKALETRWQEVLLEMASSDDDEDALLEDDEDEVNDNEGDENDQDESEREWTYTKQQEGSIKTMTATAEPIVIRVQEEGKESAEEEEEDPSYSSRRNLLNKRSDSVPDNFSKYKVNKDTTTAAIDEQGDKEGANDDNDPPLGSEATIEEMLASGNSKHLMHYIQRLKTDTVTKARAGSKMEALQGMKNVKLLQQRLEEVDPDYEGAREE